MCWGNEYNGLLARLSQQNGFNSDATVEAYERTGARDRAKDVFFFYPGVRGNDISIVNCVLYSDEIDGTENELEGLTETT